MKLKLPYTSLSRRAATAALLSTLAAVDPKLAFADANAGLAVDATGKLFYTSDGPAADAVTPKTAKETARVFMDISIDNVKAGRLLIALYGDVAPKTAENFRQLCTGENGYGYAGSSFYRIIDSLTIQGGNIVDKNCQGIKSLCGRSIYGDTFPHENYDLAHSAVGTVSMVNSGKGGAAKSSDSRFLIQLMEDGGWADGRYPAFGRVIEGMDVVRKIEAVQVTGTQNKPVVPVRIDAAGEVSLS